MTEPFRLGLTSDFLNSDGTLGFGDIGLEILDGSPVEYEFLPDYGSELPGQLASAFDGLLVLSPSVTAVTVANASRLTIVARFGVGYDNVDVEACTRNDVMLTITPDGVRRPVAVSAITLLLALSHRLLVKDTMTREGRWHEKMNAMGVGVTGRTLGLIGLGNIGREILKIAAPLEMRHVAFDPFVSEEGARACGAELLSLEAVLQQSDFVCVCCALTADTHHLLDERRLQQLKPTAFLINVARGPIVDQRALTQMLQQQRIAGAGLDVFEREPIERGDPLLQLENVILSPHGICWTDELFRGNGRSACESVLEVARGQTPRDVVNRDALSQPGCLDKLALYAKGKS